MRRLHAIRRKSGRAVRAGLDYPPNLASASQPCPKELALASASQLSGEDLALKSVTPCAAAAGDDMEEIGKGDGPVNSIPSTIAGVANDDNYGHVKALLKSCE